MELDDIVRRFARMADLDANREERFRSLCETVRRQVEGLKKTNAGKEGDDILCEAAAALALYRWTMQGAAAGMDSFSAGEIQVKRSGANVEFARQLWHETQAAAAPYLRDCGFVFAGITA